MHFSMFYELRIGKNQGEIDWERLMIQKSKVKMHGRKF